MIIEQPKKFTEMSSHKINTYIGTNLQFSIARSKPAARVATH